MITAIIIISLAFAWLGYESKWLTIRLEQYSKTLPIKVEPKFKAILCKHGATHYGDDFKAYELPERTVKAFGHTMTLAQGCNICRSKLLKAVVKAQKPHKPSNPYPVSHYTIGMAGGMRYGYEYDTGDITITANGKTINVNGEYKKGMIRDFVKANK